jgi:hypothetical protein
MSASLAAARKRRGGIVESTPPPQPPQVSNVQPGQQAGLTLPQVIALVDKRLMILETFMQLEHMRINYQQRVISNI